MVSIGKEFRATQSYVQSVSGGFIKDVVAYPGS